MSDKTYKIVRFQAENVKRLQAVEISPDGNLIEITGKNGNGKSSLLDAIFYALGGTKDIPATPIRKGEQKAMVHLDLGEIRVTRRFTAQEDGTYNTTLVVENGEGARYSSPQSILDALIGQLAFDPLEFTRLKARDQFDTLKQFVPDFDFVANAKVRKDAFDDRTAVNRDIKNLKSQVAGFSVPEGTPDIEIDVSALTEKMQKVGEHNASIEQRKANRERVADDAVRFRQEAGSLEQQAIDYRRLADEADEKAKALRADADACDKRLADAGPLPEPMDASEVRAEIERANQINSAVRDKQRMNQIIREVEAKEAEAAALNKAIDDADAAKAKAIAEAKMPIEGIGFAEDYVTLNDLPFEQASSAEQLRASIAIAVAANPKLRVLIVRDGALLDDESMGIVASMAEEHGVQVWIETVASDRPSAVVIEDGRLAESETPRVAAE